MGKKGLQAEGREKENAGRKIQAALLNA